MTIDLDELKRLWKRAAEDGKRSVRYSMTANELKFSAAMIEEFPELIEGIEALIELVDGYEEILKAQRTQPKNSPIHWQLRIKITEMVGNLPDWIKERLG